MAITLLQKPDAISPVFSDRNKFIMSEPTATYFTLVFSGDVSGTFKAIPNTLGIAEFNARYLLANYIKSLIALPGISPLPDGIKIYSVQITSSLSTVLNVTDLKFFNGALQDREINKAFNGFVLNNAYDEGNKSVSFFNGVDSKLQFTDLTGVNIIRYEGTSTLSIVGNDIIGTQGTCFNLLLSDGYFFANPHNGKYEIISYQAAFNEVLDFSAPLNFYDLMNF